MTIWEDFETRYATQCGALRADPQLDDGTRRAFADHVNGCPAGKEPIKHAKEFCYNHQLIGAVTALTAHEILGHLHRTNELQILIEEALEVSSSAANDMLQDWMSLSDADQLKEINATIGAILMGKFIMWSFRNAAARGPFSGLVLKDIPCRLGLDEDAYRRYYHWGLSLPDGIDAHIPTAFDAAMGDKWAPGGYTKPNASCSGTYPVGLPEVVHEPAKFESIRSAIRLGP